MQPVDAKYIERLRKAKRNKCHNKVMKDLWEKIREKYLIEHGTLTAGGEELLIPDFVFMDRSGGRDIRYIIEVETSGGRKSIPGAAILADYCIGERKKSENQKGEPVLLFILLENKQLAKKRIDSLKRNGYFKNIDVEVFTPEEATKFLEETP